MTVCPWNDDETWVVVTVVTSLQNPTACTKKNNVEKKIIFGDRPLPELPTQNRRKSFFSKTRRFITELQKKIVF